VLLKALRYGNRKPRVNWSTTKLQLLTREGLNNDDSRGTIEVVSQATDTETGSYIGETQKENPSRR
jgi:hypothetical protein